MKTHVQTTTRHQQRVRLIGFLMLTMLAFNSAFSQTERTVKGMITDEDGPLEAATVILKGTNIYIDTDEKGAFTFPQELKENDVLIVSHLGFKNQEITIDSNTDFIDVVMNDYAIILVGALRVGNNNSTVDKFD